MFLVRQSWHFSPTLTLQPEDHARGWCNASPAPDLLPPKLQTRNTPGVHWWTSEHWFHSAVLFFTWCPHPFCKEEGWIVMALCGLPEPEQSHKERPLPIATHHWLIRCATEGQDIYQNWPPTCVPPCPDRWRWWMENGFSDLLQLLQMASYALRVDQWAHGFPTIHEWHLQRFTRPVRSSIPWWYPDLLR